MSWGLAASAYESECRPDPSGQLARNRSTMTDSICGSIEGECSSGHQAARGALIGEHSLIALQAMLWAGIPTALAEDPFVLRYFSDGQPAPDAAYQSVQPAGPGGMRMGINVTGTLAQAQRRVSLAEFAHVPDWSWSLSDYLKGNEHCPVRNNRLAPDEIDACHDFASHMGIANSNHFAPQNKAMYELYHRLAVKAARRCSRMEAAMEQTPAHVHTPAVDRMLDECEREALIFETVGQHFLADAWSSGHMWQRWGSPHFPKDDDQYVDGLIVALVSGLIHGYRSVAESLPIGRAYVHDQLCMPGYFDEEPAPNSQAALEKAVHWTYPGGKAPLQLGGGDLYLLWCRGRGEQASSWALMPFTEERKPGSSLGDSIPEGHRLSAQYLRMLTCSVRSYEEVYNQGPRRATRNEPLVPATRILDPEIGPANPQYDPQAPGDDQTGPRNPLCWEQRVTNSSMILGAGVHNGAFANPNLLSKVIPAALPPLATTTAALQDFDHYRGLLGARNRLVRDRLVEMVRLMRENTNPQGTNLADLQALTKEDRPYGRYGLLESFLGFKRNSTYVPEITQDRVTYLERHDPQTWGLAPEAITDCVTDNDCWEQNPRLYCDRTAKIAAGGSVRPGCVPRETAVLRAFRQAETPFWCTGDSWAALNAARDACKGKAFNSAECRACMQVIRPRLRNACDAGEQGFPPTVDGRDTRSVCDVFWARAVSQAPADDDLQVHWPYEPQSSESWEDAAERAAFEACQAGGDLLPRRFDYQFNASPPAQAEVLDLPWAGKEIRAATCGLGTGTHWRRFRLTQAHGWPRIDFTLRPFRGTYPHLGTLEDLELTRFQGPRCDETLDRISDAQPIDTDSDGIADTLAFNWSVPDGVSDEICVRIKAKRRASRTGYFFRAAPP
jgi:hypothetical protein